MKIKKAPRLQSLEIFGGRTQAVYAAAIMLISTFANLGKALTCTVSRAGKSPLKYLP